MDTHLRLDADAAGPVVVKTAAPGAAAARLRREAERLARAVHPGVVALAPVAGGVVGAGPIDEVRTRYAGEPVSSWTGSLASVAGVGVSVAATLADLHDVGIVHGCVDASHVLIGDDGRPRLCGLAPADGATRADDVAALAAVVSGLLDRVGDADRRGWARLAHLVTGGGRRAEERAIRQVIAGALDPVPSRRPSARGLAEALLDAVPRAELPPATAAGAGQPGPVDPDTFERFWARDPDRRADERWAEVFGVGPPGAPPAARAAPPLAEVVAAEWGDPPEPASDEPEVGLTRELRSRPGGRAAGARVPEGADVQSAPARRRRRVLVATASGGAFAAAVAVSLVATRPGGGGPGPGAVPDAGSPPPAGASRPGPAVDIDGDGNPEALVVDGASVTAGSARWTLGEPGDVVAVGDWDCRDGPSPALLRPATGDVFVFPSWAPPDEPVTVDASQRIPGAIGIRAEPVAGGCDDIVVDLPGGLTRTVEVPR